MQGEDKHWGMAHDLMPLLTTVLSVKLSWPTSGISSAANQYIYILVDELIVSDVTGEVELMETLTC
jgi:hypothetical protein